jgi:hypothetical protein
VSAFFAGPPGDCVFAESAERCGDLIWVRDLHESHDVRGVLVVESIWTWAFGSIVELVGLRDKQGRWACHLRLKRPVVCRIERRDGHRAVVHERRLESDGSAGSSVAVNPQASRASPLSRGGPLRDDEVHRDEDLLAACRGFGEPNPRLYVTAFLGLKIEPGGGHRGLELRRVLEEPGVQDPDRRLSCRERQRGQRSLCGDRRLVPRPG